MSPAGAVDNYSWNPAMSADGRWVAFTSTASNLVANDTNKCRTPEGFLESCNDVFVADRRTGAVTRVSVGTDGSEGDRGSGGVAGMSISGDGRFVVFESLATNLISGGANGGTQILVRDRDADEDGVFDEPGSSVTELASLSAEGDQANRNAEMPSVSADGRHVVFSSFADNLVPGDTNGHRDIFVRDRGAGTTARVSVATDGSQTAPGAAGGTGSLAPGGSVVSGDGRYVVFQSNAKNLVEGDTNSAYDVFVRDRDADADGVFDEPDAVRTVRASAAPDGSQAGKGSSRYGSISDDGRYVVFASAAKGLVPGPALGTAQLFLRDRDADGNGIFDEVAGTANEVVSVSSAGTQTSESYLIWPAKVSAGGRYVTHAGGAGNLVEGDTNERSDVFIHDRLLRLTERVSIGDDGTQADANMAGGYLGGPPVSADGRHVAFHGPASTLSPATTREFFNVFARDRGPTVGIGGLDAVAAQGQVTLSGWAAFAGVVLASGEDEVGDVATVAGQVGAELTGASVAYHPSTEDLLVRVHVAGLPEQPDRDRPLLGAPGVVYGLAFSVQGIRYELRARVSFNHVHLVPSLQDPRFTLYKCEPACVETHWLAGAYGLASNEAVRVSLPVEAFSGAGGAELDDVRAFTALESGASDAAARTLDELALGEIVVPAAALTGAIAPPGTSQADVHFDVDLAGTLVNGAFTGALDTSRLAGGAYDIWAKACLGETCGAASVRVTVEPPA